MATFSAEKSGLSRGSSDQHFVIILMISSSSAQPSSTIGLKGLLPDWLGRRTDSTISTERKEVNKGLLDWKHIFSRISPPTGQKGPLNNLKKRVPQCLKKFRVPPFFAFFKKWFENTLGTGVQDRDKGTKLPDIFFLHRCMNPYHSTEKKASIYSLNIEGFFSLLSIQMHHLHICIAKLMQYFSKKKKFFKVLSLYLPNSLQKTDTFPPKVWKSSFIGTFSRRTTMAKSWWRRRTSWLLTSRIFI